MFCVDNVPADAGEDDETVASCLKSSENPVSLQCTCLMVL